MNSGQLQTGPLTDKWAVVYGTPILLVLANQDEAWGVVRAVPIMHHSHLS